MLKYYLNNTRIIFTFNSDGFMVRPLDMNEMKMQDDMNSIPLADDDPQVIIQEDGDAAEMSQASDAMVLGRSMDSIPSTFTNGSSSPGPNSLDPDISPDEQEEKARLISQVLELQNTLDGE
ncbi:hypothetical protein GE061_012952 [Apolygus lucorum]|uniref:Uncharacterized protein n=1 Tax=Apolygus lucorum TaxID=248454 RepID=A0A8S9XV52_APOLU|nr:hypothetical protein GE061_012952 [Apolygus lucorum]